MTRKYIDLTDDEINRFNEAKQRLGIKTDREALFKGVGLVAEPRQVGRPAGSNAEYMRAKITATDLAKSLKAKAEQKRAEDSEWLMKKALQDAAKRLKEEDRQTAEDRLYR